MLRRHLKYLYNCLFHKWHVFWEAAKLGIYWRGLVHDFSKLSPHEWLPRAKALGKNKPENQYGVFESLDAELVLSWLRHYHRNPHHWQWWVTRLDNGERRVLPMTDEYRREMLADWRAVSKMPGRQDVVPWYLQNKENIELHPETRSWIEKQLGVS